MNPIFRRTIYCGFGAVVGAGYGSVASIAAFDGQGIGTILAVVVSTAIVAFLAKGIATEPTMTEFQRLGAVLMAPAMLAVAVMVVLFFLPFVMVFVPLGFGSWLRHEWTLRKTMKQRGRYLTWELLTPKLENGEGTLIEETGQKGPYHAWWTDEDVSARGSLPSSDEELVAIIGGTEHPLNSECLADYLDPETGRALLTPIKPRQLRSGEIAKRFPRMRCVKLVRSLVPDQAG